MQESAKYNECGVLGFEVYVGLETGGFRLGGSAVQIYNPKGPNKLGNLKIEGF